MLISQIGKRISINMIEIIINKLNTNLGNISKIKKTQLNRLEKLKELKIEYCIEIEVL